MLVKNLDQFHTIFKKRFLLTILYCVNVNIFGSFRQLPSKNGATPPHRNEAKTDYGADQPWDLEGDFWTGKNNA